MVKKYIRTSFSLVLDLFEFLACLGNILGSYNCYTLQHDHKPGTICLPNGAGHALYSGVSEFFFFVGTT